MSQLRPPLQKILDPPLKDVYQICYKSTHDNNVLIFVLPVLPYKISMFTFAPNYSF